MEAREASETRNFCTEKNPNPETKMKYAGFTTFRTEQNEGVLTVTFDFGSVNVQGQEMLADLNSLAMRLEHDMENQRTWNDLVMKVQEIQ